MSAQPIPDYTTRWDFYRRHRELSVCDVCSMPVAPISVGWAHAFDSADHLAAHDFSTTRHIPTVQGHEQ